MRIFADVLKPNPVVIVEHEGETLEFSCKSFDRRSLQNHLSIFQEINIFWSRKSPAEQQKIWMIYKEANDAFDMILTSSELCDVLRAQITKLAELHHLSDLRHGVQLYGNVVIPDNVEDDYVHDINNKHTRDKTYTKSEYLDLVALALLFRALIPIWGEYINSTQQVVGKEHREFNAILLLQHTPIMELPPVIKLQEYVKTLIGFDTKDPSKYSKIVDGHSTEDIHFVYFAQVCLRRICTASFSGVPHPEEEESLKNPNLKTNIAAAVYYFIMQKTRGGSRAGDDRNAVKEKMFSGDGDSSGKESGQRSIMERYRKRTDHSMGELVEMQHSLKDYQAIAQILAPGIDRDFVEKSVQSAQFLKGNVPGDAVIYLLGYVFKRVISPRALFYIRENETIYDKNQEIVNTLVNAFGVLEAVLWQWGHKYMAIFATSYPIRQEDEMSVAPIDSRGQIGPELTAQLLKYYPYRGFTFRRNTQEKIMENPPILTSIDICCENIYSNAWRATAREELLTEVFGKVRRRFPIYPSIKADLARVILDVGSNAHYKPKKNINDLGTFQV